MNAKEMYEKVKDKEMIIMACNTRMTPGVVKGIMKAAKETNSAVVFELAKSESNLEGGYTGLTPKDFCSRVIEAGKQVDFDGYALHADHITLKKGTPEEIEDTKKLIREQIAAGYTSFAIDASYLFDINGKNEEEELAKNVAVTTEFYNFLKDNVKGDFGLEVEVGEIGRKNDEGLVLTTPKEAETYMRMLAQNKIKPNMLAIANGSTHGNLFDAKGKSIVQSSIDIAQTIAVGKAIEPFGVKIAQHGITGTPLKTIKEEFPKKYLRKGNVGTHWMNLVWDVLKEMQPELYQELWDAVLEKHSTPGKSDAEIFGKKSKLLIKDFKDKIDALPKDVLAEIENKAYKDALEFFDAFGANNSL